MRCASWSRIVLVGVVAVGAAACGEALTETFGPDAPGIASGSDGEGAGNTGAGGGPPARYQGQYQAEVHYLLGKFTWSTPRDAQDEAFSPPDVPVEPSCMRDLYVSAAVNYAWAAEATYRLRSMNDVAKSIAGMRQNLDAANALCSSAPNFGPSPCSTLSVWGCPPPM